MGGAGSSSIVGCGLCVCPVSSVTRRSNRTGFVVRSILRVSRWFEMIWFVCKEATRRKMGRRDECRHNLHSNHRCTTLPPPSLPPQTPSPRTFRTRTLATHTRMCTATTTNLSCLTEHVRVRHQLQGPHVVFDGLRERTIQIRIKSQPHTHAGTGAHPHAPLGTLVCACLARQFMSFKKQGGRVVPLSHEQERKEGQGGVLAGLAVGKKLTAHTFR